MSRYIDADKLRNEVISLSASEFTEWATIGVLSTIDRQPTADVVEVRHGEWEPEMEGSYPTGYYFCSLCGRATDWKSRYCPSCGAKMDLLGGDDNGDL